MSLETEDIPGVELLAAGGPYFGAGTAKGGDHYTVADLERFAANARELAGEVRIPIKLGHSPEQRLLRESGLFDEHGQPAAGWIENVRVQGTKLVGDARRVPKKLAGLVNAGAFRTRSVEQRLYTGQGDANRGKSYGWVIDGLALLGAKAPAVRTLDDIVALYSADPTALDAGADDPPEGVRTINYSAASITGGDMTLTLTPEQTADVAKALGIEKPEDLAADKLLAAIDTAKKAAAAAAADPVKAELGTAKGELDTAKKELADATTELTALRAAGGGEGGEELADQIKKLSAKADAGERAEEELRKLRRDTLVDGAIKRFALAPSERDKYVALYDAAPDATRALLEGMPRRDDLVKTFGADGDGGQAGEPTDAEKAEKDALARHLAATTGSGAVKETVAA